MLGSDFLLQILLLRTLLERPTLQRNISIFIQSQSTMSYVTCTYLGRLFPSFVSFKELLKFQQMKGTSWMLWLQRINFPHKYYICVNGAYRDRISKTNESSFNSTLANETLSSNQREFNKKIYIFCISVWSIDNFVTRSCSQIRYFPAGSWEW